MIFFGLAAAWLGRELDRAFKQEAIRKQLKAQGMGTVYDFDRHEAVRFEVPRLPCRKSLLRTVSRQDMFAHVDRAVWANRPGIEVEKTLSLLPSLSRLTELEFRKVPLTDGDLALI